MLCACNQLFGVYNGSHNNENNMSYSNTGCLILKVHMWNNMVARKEQLQSFSKSGVPMVKHPDRIHLRAFRSSFKSVN